MENYKQGDIVFVPFPHSDLDNIKFRPALIVSNDQLRGDDFIACAISSQKPRLYAVSLVTADLEDGKLPVSSYVKVDKLISLHKTLIRKRMARVSSAKMRDVATELAKILKPM